MPVMKKALLKETDFMSTCFFCIMTQNIFRDIPQIMASHKFRKKSLLLTYLALPPIPGTLQTETNRNETKRNQTPPKAPPKDDPPWDFQDLDPDGPWVFQNEV